MRIVCLMENTACEPSFRAEHGLSFYIETGEHRILVDMGQTEAFAENARLLGIDLAGVDLAILTHGHYDHGGGLKHFLEINSEAPVYLHRDAFEPHYNGTEKYIGLDLSLLGEKRLVFVDREYSPGNGITIHPGETLPLPHGLNSGGLTVLRNGIPEAEDFSHEIYLAVEENGHTVLFSGCSHRGILNLADAFRPAVLVGGFHFSKFPLDEQLAEYARYLNRFDTTFLTGHCTGLEQYRYMKTYMEHLDYLTAGQEWTRAFG